MRPLSLLLVLGAALLAACGSSSTTTSSAPPASTASTASTSSAASAAPATSAPTVVMQNVSFTPGVIHVKVGQTITFKNQDNPPHNVTWVSGPKFTSSGTINPGQSFHLKVTQAGTIHYYCTIHPFMKAEIVVGQ